MLDVHRDRGEVQRSPLKVGLYISFFPQLIAGPIVKYETVAQQIDHRKETWADFSAGCSRFIVGLGKKVLLSNQLAVVADRAFGLGDGLSASFAWLGALCYTLQIYYDFSGYSDMAIGLGKMFGFHFLENFQLPLHLPVHHRILAAVAHLPVHLVPGLCVYPLGGNRCGKLRPVCQHSGGVGLTGFWQRRGWNFLFWGFYYGVLLLLEKLLLGKYIRRLPAVFQHLYAMVIVIIGWVFFASPDLSTALAYLQVMFSFSPGTMGGASLVMPWLGMAVIGVVAATPLAKNLWEKLQGKKAMPLVEGALCLAALLLCTASLVSDSYNPFLYFRF